ncbi:hypothetical protein SAMN05444161_7785 [Rhizobiales bacterium GAS191]|jgi:hypothetical protein|nr:hypothetical protein SAMN05519103_07076 [Rhizobiales bacterium GAS113]SED51266.1 hypothetical protein SAMN05519104_3704 [Rhizobiales bacterium GAS188]SEE91018.1 hypothetical protein SAMN05444161_7785 [Rhizobiales bacterium GAS191]
MAELLLSHTSVKLYGRVVQDLKYVHHAPNTMAPSANQFLSNQLQDTIGKDKAHFARIYGFSYQGHYYTLAKPAVFLVHGEGLALFQGDDAPGSLAAAVGGSANRTTLDESGVMAREWEFASQFSKKMPDIRYWEYEKGDFSVRLDIDSGPLDQILLAASISAGTALTSGEDLRLGGDVRNRR